MNTLHVRKDDTVVILSGKDKGKKGKVLEVSPTEKKVIVEGCPKCGKPTRLAHKILADGTKVRVCKNADCGETF